jgi:DNA-binding GntR family transcriptional regulator
MLLEAIEAGTWKPGERLPSEADIVEALPFSLGTVQRALQTLVEQGVVRRRHGQGSFVAGLPVNTHEIRNFRFLDDDGKSLLPVYGRMLRVELTEDTGPWSDFLGAAEPFVRISRLINVNLEFQTFSQVFLPHRKFAELLEMPPSKISASLTHMLSERFNSPTLHVTHTVCSEPLPDEASLAIGEEAGSTGMRWEIFSYTYRNLPSFYQRVYLPLTSRRLQFSDHR